MDKSNWNLENILTLKDFDKFSTNFISDLQSFNTNFDSIPSPISDKDFSKLINSYIEISETINILYARAYLAEELNCIGEEEKLLKSKANNCLIQYHNNSRPFIHWLKGLRKHKDAILDDDSANILFKTIPTLEYYLQRLRKLKKHTLSMQEEEIISNKDITGIQALLDLRSIIENEQIYKAKIDGKEKTFNTSSNLAKYFKDNDRNNRVNAYNALYEIYQTNLTKYFSIYQSIVKDWTFEANLRKYNSNISVRNFANDIKDSTVTLLLDSCQNNKNVFNEFFSLKAKELGIPKPTRYDIYAPILGKEKKINYKDGLEILLNVFKDFDKDLYQMAKEYFQQDKVDVYPSDNKRSGAFCANITNKINPYLLLNYTNTSRDLFTLAHEFGHASHYILSQDQSVLTQDAPLTLAETASTFTENIVFDYLYKNETDKSIKKSMLFEKIADAYASISRQAYFVKFEQEAHILLNQGIKLDDFNNVYLQNLKSQFENYVEIPEIFKYEWSYIPHIVNAPFYCYAYPFGNLLSFSLYENYLENDGSFIGKYKRILKSGGSKDPYKLLKDEGFDIDNPEFFNNGFKLINQWVEELKKLV
jgi:oligoendopeptidase F